MTDILAQGPAAAGIDAAQTNGTAPVSNLQEPSYDVEVQLSDLQKDTEHPLGSAHSFQELGLSVLSHPGIAL
jgi:ATP-dependent RNA helicase DDX19/DBP5